VVIDMDYVGGSKLEVHARLMIVPLNISKVLADLNVRG
jgi:hypothetical protein